MDEKDKKISLLTNIIIVLGTIIVGLSSYIFYTAYKSNGTEKAVCEYNGWAYSDGESFQSSDGCNTCSCSNGQVACTEMACDTTTDSSSGVCSVGDTTCTE